MSYVVPLMPPPQGATGPQPSTMLLPAPSSHRAWVRWQDFCPCADSIMVKQGAFFRCPSCHTEWNKTTPLVSLPKSPVSQQDTAVPAGERRKQLKAKA